MAKTIETQPLTFYVNGVKVVEDKPEPELTLAWYLREKLGLTGTKLGCEEGQCGSCTVAVARMEGDSPKYRAVNACLLSVGLVHGCSVTTVEGLGSTREALHPIQERLWKGHGSQCGFCTPGFVMSMFALLRNNPAPTKKEIENALIGNLCRCTGYRPILQSLGSFDTTSACDPENCCKNKKAETESSSQEVAQIMTPYDSSQDPIFPPELKVSNVGLTSTCIAGTRTKVFLPTTMEEMRVLLAEFPKAQLIASGSLVGLFERYASKYHDVWISTSRVRELKKTESCNNELKIGAALTIAEVDEYLQEIVQHHELENKSLVSCFSSIINDLFSVQLRNLVSWSGNVVSGSPISDLIVPLLAFGMALEVESPQNETRKVPLRQEFFKDKGWPKVDLKPGEIVTSLCIPSASKEDFFMGLKQGMRKGSDSAVVNAAAWLRFKQDSAEIEEARLVFGGMSSRAVVASKTAAALIGPLNEDHLNFAVKAIADELSLKDGAFGGKIQYRNALCQSFLLKVFIGAQKWLIESGRHPVSQLNARLNRFGLSTLGPFQSQHFIPDLPSTQAASDPIGRSEIHMHGARHTTGEAVYTGDISANRLCYLGLVLSTRCHARIVSIDWSGALSVPGVLTSVGKEDVPASGTNQPGIPDSPDDEPDFVFADSVVTSVGQLIGAIVADDVITARRAASLVKVEYEDLPSILTIKDAISKSSFLAKEPIVIEKGSVDEGFSDSSKILSGDISLGGQEHLYLETQSAVALPGEEKNWEIAISTQDPKSIQKVVSRLLGVPLHCIVTKTVRIGGAFGGKLTQSALPLLPAVVAAEKLRRPVKCVLTRKEDIVMTGKRHPASMHYRVGFDKEGCVKSLEAEIFLDGGHTVDQSNMVLMVCMHHFALSYKIPNLKLTGRAVKTNLPSNTGFRAFGNPQGNFFMERIIDAIAEELKLPSKQIREINFASAGDSTTSKDVIAKDDNLLKCWNHCLEISSYNERTKLVNDFNNKNKFVKRGIVQVPVRWGLGMGGSSFEQGAVLMNVYTDGSILISHGGIEMGQGLNTKVLQCASRALGLPIDKFTILDNASDKVPNPTVSGGSQGSDVHGLAAKEAAEILLQRLSPYKERNPKGNWADWVKAANEDRISLSVTAIGRPKIPEGKPPFTFRYFVTGAACVEVEIDTLTGEHQVIRTDIVMDLGKSMNPAIDIGQIEGAFVQGYGLYTCEELSYSETDGQLISNSAGKYKIPGVANIPNQFNVHLIDGGDNYNVYSSKGVGEPPLLLGVGGYFAILDAVRAARKEFSVFESPDLPSPATPEQIRNTCSTKIIEN